MSLKTKLPVLAGALIISSLSYATPMIAPTCPSISTIKSEGITEAAHLIENLFLSYHSSQYNSDQQWIFAMAPIEADSENEAIKVSNDLLKSMTAAGIPEERQGITVCTYNTNNNDVEAIAAPMETGLSPLGLKSLFK